VVQIGRGWLNKGVPKAKLTKTPNKTHFVLNFIAICSFLQPTWKTETRSFGPKAVIPAPYPRSYPEPQPHPSPSSSAAGRRGARRRREGS